MTTFWANGFRSELPPGWSDRSTLTLVGPVAADGFMANLVVTRQPLPDGTRVADFARRELEALTREVPRVEVDEEREVRHRGLALYQRVHRLEAGNRVIRQLQTYLVLERPGGCEGLVVTGSASPAAFDDVLPAFVRFIDRLEPFEGPDRSGDPP